jgi:hypothetical protein
MPTRLGFLVTSLLLSPIAAAGPIVSIPGPVDAEGKPARRQLWRVPSTDPDVLMFTTVFRPSGTGPFPLVVMNHGTTQDDVQRAVFSLAGVRSGRSLVRAPGVRRRRAAAPWSRRNRRGLPWRTRATAVPRRSWPSGARVPPTSRKPSTTPPTNHSCVVTTSSSWGDP